MMAQSAMVHTIQQRARQGRSLWQIVMTGDLTRRSPDRVSLVLELVSSNNKLLYNSNTRRKSIGQSRKDIMVARMRNNSNRLQRRNTSYRQRSQVLRGLDAKIRF